MIMAIRNILCVLLLFISAVPWTQVESNCGSTAPVTSTCETTVSTDDWLSELTAVEVNFTSVTLSWYPQNSTFPTNQSYEILFRRFSDSSRHDWNTTPELNDVYFDATSGTFSYTFNGLRHNVTYEMRICLSPAPSLSPEDPPPPECGYCNLCFRTKDASIYLLEARREMSSDETIYVCEAASNPPSTVRWIAQMSGNSREPLEETSSDYEISSSTNRTAIPPVTTGELEYNPNEVDFTNPECFIENGFDTIRVRNPSFEQSTDASDREPIVLLSARVETQSNDNTIYVCEASSNPLSVITWDAAMAGTREPLAGGMNPTYSISNTMDSDTFPPVRTSYLEYNPEEVAFRSPECVISNGFGTMRVRTFEFEEEPSMSTEINLVNAYIEEQPDGIEAYVCEVTSNSAPEFSWETTIDESRVTLSPNNSDAVYIITTTVNNEVSPIFGRSTIEYAREELTFPRPDCVVTNAMSFELRVRPSDFTVMEPPTRVSATVTVPLWGIALLVVIPLIIIVALIALGVGCKCMVIHKHKRRVANIIDKREMKQPNDYASSLPRTIPSNSSNPDSSIFYGPLETALPRDMIVPNSDIKVSSVIGQGEFGVVYKGTLTHNNHRELVAVKTLKGIFATPSDIQGFTEEILILQHFNHPNVMSLIGVCLGADKIGGGPSIILPFMSKGSLLNFLRKEAERLKPSKIADVAEIGAVEKSLVQICLQIARGMEYLAGQRFVHRDLAARNCMIDQNDQIKVGDFGLSEDIYAKNYFRQTSSDGVKLPVKWMAIESLKLGVFSEKSDVWSYGVTCWEVFSCGEIPYPGIHPQEVLQLLEGGHRLRKPSNPACSNELYTALGSCWEADPSLRMTFTELCSMLERQLQSMSDYLDLNVIASTSFNPPSQENLYDKAQELYEDESNVHDLQSTTSVDMLYEGEPEDEMYIDV